MNPVLGTAAAPAPAKAAATAHLASAAAAAARLATAALRGSPDLGTGVDQFVRDWIDRIAVLVRTHDSADVLQDALLSAFGDLPADELADVMSLAFELSELQGIDSVRTERVDG